MNVPMLAAPVSSLRQRLIDDMTMRRFSRETQRNYIRDVGRFATFLGRPPDTATADDLRRFQVEQRDAGVPVPTMNSIVSALRFFFTHITLAVDEFIRRFLLHVLPRGFHRIRHYGLLASTARKASLALARALLDVAPPPDNNAPEEPLDARPPCPCCGGHMIVIETFARWCQPRAPPQAPRPAGSIRA